MFRSRKKENVPIELSLDFNEALGVSSVTAIATSILKHILYQRRQVPLVVEVLEREAALDIPLKAATTASVSELRLTDNNEESASSRRRNTVSSKIFLLWSELLVHIISRKEMPKSLLFYFI